MTAVRLKLDAYIRVSKVRGREGDSFISPKVQRERIAGWAKTHDHEVTWHEPELDVSGGTMRRPVFDQLMERVRSGKSDGVIVAKLDRFARTLVGALSTLEEFERHDAVLVSVAESIDLSTPMGRAFLRMLLVFAELERDRITESWETACSTAVARGIHIAKFTPMGYVKGEDKRLRPGPLAPAIREVFRMRAAHNTRTEIARRLDEIAPRPEGGRWVPKDIERIVKNRVYMGEAYRGEAVNPHAHEPIVSFAEWQAANLAPVRASHRGKQPNLLGGIVRCAGCRYVLAPQISGGDKPTPYRVYRCRGVHTGGACPAPASIYREPLDDYVEAAWREQMADQALAVKQDSKALAAAAAELKTAEEELSTFASDLTARRLLGDGYHAALRTRAKAVDQARAKIAQAGASGVDASAIAGYDDLSIEERKRILSGSIDAVMVKPGRIDTPLAERVTILWRGEGPDDLPRRGRSNGPIRSYAP